MTSTERKATVALVAVAAMMMAGRQTPKRAGRRARPREATIVLHVTNYAALSREIQKRPALASRDQPAHRRAHRMGRWRGKLENVRTAGSISPSCCSHATWPKRKIRREGLKDGVRGEAHASERARVYLLRPHRDDARRPQRISRTRSATSSPTKWAISCWVRIAIPPSGIMRAHTDVRAFHLESFDKAQAPTIRTKLMEVGRVTER